MFGAVFAAISALGAVVGAWFAYKAAPKMATKLNVECDAAYFDERQCLRLRIIVDNESPAVAEDVSLVMKFPETWSLRYPPPRRGSGGMWYASDLTIDGNLARTHGLRVVNGVPIADYLLVTAPEGDYTVRWKLRGRNVPHKEGDTAVHIPTIEEARARVASD